MNVNVSVVTYILALIIFAGCGSQISKFVGRYERNSVSAPQPIELAGQFVFVGDTLSVIPENAILPIQYSILNGEGVINASTGEFHSSVPGISKVQVKDGAGVLSLMTIEAIPKVSVDSNSLQQNGEVDLPKVLSDKRIEFKISNPISELADYLSAELSLLTLPWFSGTLSLNVKIDKTTLRQNIDIKLPPSSRHFGGAFADSPSAIYSDKQGGIIVLYSGNEPAGELPSYGGIDLQIRKFDKRGKEVWRNRVGSTADDFFKTSIQDSDGNVYFTVAMSSAWGIAPIAGGANCNLIKVNNNDGSIGWIKTINATNYNFCNVNALADGDKDHIFMTGLGGGTSPFEGGEIPLGHQDIFISKLRKSDGSAAWLRFLRVITSYMSTPTYDPVEDAVYLSGLTSGTLPGEVVKGGRDLVIAKYDKDGNKLWHDDWGHPDGWSNTQVMKPFLIEDRLISCGYTGQVYPQNNGYPYMVIYKKDGTLISEKRFPEVRSTTNVFANCFKFNGRILLTFRSLVPPTGYTNLNSVSDSYYYYFDLSGNLLESHQLVDLPAISTISPANKMLGFISTSLDLMALGVTGSDLYIMEIAGLGTVPKIVRAGFAESSPTSQCGGTPSWGPLGDLFLLTCSSGTIDNHVSYGDRDIFLLKYNSDLLRQ